MKRGTSVSTELRLAYYRTHLFHRCDDDLAWDEIDVNGDFLCRVCDECREAKLSRFKIELIDFGGCD